MLSIDDILTSRAYVLDYPVEAFPEYVPSKGRTLNFTCWYDPAVPVGGQYMGQAVQMKHALPVTMQVLETVNNVKGSIQQKGLLNPVLMRQKMGVWVLEPGKCRVQALKLLGIDKIPAICVSHDHKQPPEWAKYEIKGPEQFKAHFTGDIAPEFTYRTVRTPKKR